MKGILADHNTDGHLEVLPRTVLNDDWRPMWNELGVPVLTLGAVATPCLAQCACGYAQGYFSTGSSGRADHSVQLASYHLTSL